MESRGLVLETVKQIEKYFGKLKAGKYSRTKYWDLIETIGETDHCCQVAKKTHHFLYQK